MKARLQNRFLALLMEKERREGRRIRQTEVAQAINVSNNTIGRWVRNEITRYDAEVVEDLCAYFECGLCDLLYMDDGTDQRAN